MSNTLTDIKKLAGLCHLNENADKESLIEELQECINEIQEKTMYALQLIRNSGETAVYQRAKAYWYGHIMSATGSDEFLSRDYSIQSSIEELQEDMSDDDEDDFDYSDGEYGPPIDAELQRKHQERNR